MNDAEQDTGPWAELGRRLRAYRQGAGHSQDALARLVHYSRPTVTNVEAGRQRIARVFWERCDEILRTGGDLAAAAAEIEARRQQLRLDTGLVNARARAAASDADDPGLSALGLPLLSQLSGHPAAKTRPWSGEDIETIRATVARLVRMEAVYGANEPARLAVRAFRAADRQVQSGPCDPRLERDLYAAVAELAEVAGWQLIDAEQQELARRLNQEALLYARLAGDRSMERLIVQNMSTQALHIGRPRESLLLARSIAETQTLTPRLAALFDIRQARALAAGGDRTALRLYDRAKSRFYDGTGPADPAWAWWIDERELATHEGNVYADLGDWRKAAACYARAVALTPDHQPRNRYVYLRLLLVGQLHLKAWRDAEETARLILPYTLEIGSARNVKGLREALPIMLDPHVPSTLRETGKALEEHLQAA